MAKSDTASPSTYVTGFCNGQVNCQRCPAVIKHNTSGKVWDCHCSCHTEGNTGWEPPAETLGETIHIPGPIHFSMTLDIEDANPDAWALIFGQEWDMVRMVEGLREVLTKMDTDT